MVSPSGEEHWLSGEYQSIEEPHKLVFTHLWDKTENEIPGLVSVCTVIFEADGKDKTKMIFKQTNLVSQASFDGHEVGWEECFDKMVVLLS